MTTQIPATPEIEKWLLIWFRFFINFYSGSRSERKTQNPAGVDSGNPDPVSSEISDHYEIYDLLLFVNNKSSHVVSRS